MQWPSYHNYTTINFVEYEHGQLIKRVQQQGIMGMPLNVNPWPSNDKHYYNYHAELMYIPNNWSILLIEMFIIFKCCLQEEIVYQLVHVNSKYCSSKLEHWAWELLKWAGGDSKMRQEEAAWARYRAKTPRDFLNAKCTIQGGYVPASYQCLLFQWRNHWVLVSSVCCRWLMWLELHVTKFHCRVS